MLLELKEQFQLMSEQMAEMRNKEDNRTTTESSRDSEIEQEPGESEEQGAVGGQLATVDTLRQDFRLMSQAAKRLARLRLDDSDDEDMDSYSRSREAGKKSGSVLTPTDKVRKQIDWPHMHIQRMFGGRKKSVSYVDLRIDEFVYGFMSMIESPQGYDKNTEKLDAGLYGVLVVERPHVLPNGGRRGGKGKATMVGRSENPRNANDLCPHSVSGGETTQGDTETSIATSTSQHEMLRAISASRMRAGSGSHAVYSRVCLLF